MVLDGMLDLSRGQGRKPVSKRRVLTIAAVAAFALSTPSPANAVAWGPLYSYYNGTSRVEGDGHWTDASSTYARNNINMNDPSNDGNNVYTRTYFLWWESDSSCGGYPPYPACWVNSGSKTTPEYNYSNTPVAGLILQKSLSTIGSRARGSTQSCAQMGWPVPDSCSDTAVPTFNY